MAWGWHTLEWQASARSSTINVGTLVVDSSDPATEQLVWTGKAMKTIDPSKSQENQKNLDKAMQKVVKNYPPKQEVVTKQLQAR